MLVRYYGFSIESPSNSISLDDIIDKAIQNNGAKNTLFNIERRLYLNKSSNPDYYIGLVITVKDQKKFCQLFEDKGKIQVKVEDLKGKNKMMEFNFFVINKSNGLGLYQHYYQSCSLNRFGEYLNDHFKDIRRTLIDKEIDKESSISGNQVSDKKIKKIQSKYKRKIKFEALASATNIEEMGDLFTQVKSLEYVITNVERDDGGVGVPVSKYSKRKKETWQFSPDIKLKNLLPAIKNTITDIKPHSGNMKVVTLDGDELSYKIYSNLDKFGEDEYDDVATNLNNLDLSIQSNNIKDNAIIADLLKKCTSDQYKHIFEAIIIP